MLIRAGNYSTGVAGGYSLTSPVAGDYVTGIAGSYGGAIVTAPVITGVTGNAAEGTVTITTAAPYTSPVTPVTYNGVTLADVVEATATTVTAAMPKGGQAFDSSNNFQITDNLGASNLFPSAFLVRSDSSYVVTTVDYAGLPPESIAFGLTEISNMEIGDEVSYTNDSLGETIVLDGQLRLAAQMADGSYSSSIYALDANDGYSSGTTGVASFSVESIVEQPESWDVQNVIPDAQVSNEGSVQPESWVTANIYPDILVGAIQQPEPWLCTNIYTDALPAPTSISSNRIVIF